MMGIYIVSSISLLQIMLQQVVFYISLHTSLGESSSIETNLIQKSKNKMNVNGDSLVGK